MIPTAGNRVVETSDVDGVIIAGIMVDAGLRYSDVLVQIGERNSDRNHADNPSSLHEFYYATVGNATSVANAKKFGQAIARVSAAQHAG